MKGGEGNKIKDGGITPKTLAEKKFFPTQIWEKTIKAFRVVLKIGILKYIQGHKYLYVAIQKKIIFLNQEVMVFLILKSYIHKLSNSTMGCHVPDANLKATLNFPDPAQSILDEFLSALF